MLDVPAKLVALGCAFAALLFPALERHFVLCHSRLLTRVGPSIVAMETAGGRAVHDRVDKSVREPRQAQLQGLQLPKCTIFMVTMTFHRLSSADAFGCLGRYVRARARQYLLAC